MIILPGESLLISARKICHRRPHQNLFQLTPIHNPKTQTLVYVTIGKKATRPQLIRVYRERMTRCVVRRFVNEVTRTLHPWPETTAPM